MKRYIYLYIFYILSNDTEYMTHVLKSLVVSTQFDNTCIYLKKTS